MHFFRFWRAAQRSQMIFAGSSPLYKIRAFLDG